MKLWIWVLIAAVVGGLIVYFYMGHKSKKVTSTMIATTATPAGTPSVAAPASSSTVAGS